MSMRMMSFAVVVALLHCGSEANAGPISIDFESLQLVNSSVNSLGGATYSEDGFTLDEDTFGGFPDFGFFGTLESRFTGSTALFLNRVGTIILSQTNGQPFDLLSIDLAELNANQSPGLFVSFTGFLSGGGTVNQTFQLDGVAFGAETFSFTGFNSLDGVEWDQVFPFHQFDNIVVTPVPEPSSFVLFGLGTVGLVLMERRRRKRKMAP